MEVLRGFPGRCAPQAVPTNHGFDLGHSVHAAKSPERAFLSFLCSFVQSKDDEPGVGPSRRITVGHKDSATDDIDTITSLRLLTRGQGGRFVKRRKDQS